MTEFYTHSGTERYFDFDDKVCDEETGKSLTVKEIVTVLNKLNDENIELHIHNDFLKDENRHMRDLVNENEDLKKENKELKFDNDIKFWKHQFMMRYNTSQIIMHELSRAIDEGYKISEEFQKYLNESKTRDSENREKIERLGI